MIWNTQRFNKNFKKIFLQKENSIGFANYWNGMRCWEQGNAQQSDTGHTNKKYSPQKFVNDFLKISN